MLIRGVRMMSYKITYGSTPKKLSADKNRYLQFIPVIILAAMLILAAFFPAELRSIRRHALPFLEPEVKAALSQMLDSIHAGTDFGDACAAFCREILFEEASIN